MLPRRPAPSGARCGWNLFGVTQECSLCMGPAGEWHCRSETTSGLSLGPCGARHRIINPKGSTCQYFVLTFCSFLSSTAARVRRPRRAGTTDHVVGAEEPFTRTDGADSIRTDILTMCQSQGKMSTGSSMRSCSTATAPCPSTTRSPSTWSEPLSQERSPTAATSTTRSSWPRAWGCPARP